MPGFCPIHFTITFDGQTNMDRYTKNIVIPKIVKLGFHCMPIAVECLEENLEETSRTSAVDYLIRRISPTTLLLQWTKKIMTRETHTTKQLFLEPSNLQKDNDPR